MLQIQSMNLLNDYIYSTVVTEQIRNGQWVGPGFLNLGTGDIWGQISLWCRGGGDTTHRSTVNRVPSLHPLDASSTPPGCKALGHTDTLQSNTNCMVWVGKEQCLREQRVSASQGRRKPTERSTERVLWREFTV